jgi:uncharacterized caspase-like protein
MAKNWAIAIGINQYELLPKTAHLSYAVRDAELMGEFLCRTAGFPAENILLCTDASSAIGRLSTRPSRSILRRILREELQRAQGADNLWFFFAGHGMAGRNGDYFLPLDGNPNDLEDTAVSVHFVTECLRRCEAKNVVLVLDMCRNEGRMDSRDISVNVGEQTIELAKQQGMITMFSCSRGERSYEIPELQQGAFTYCLVNGLKQHTILRQLEQYLIHEVPKLRQRYNRQIPVPCIIPEPGWKYDAPLLPGYATQADVGLLREQAIEAELYDDFEQARQLWWQVVDAGSSAERAQAREALDRIRLKENRAQMPSPMHSPAPVPPPTPPSQRTTKQPVTSPPSSPEKPDSQKVAPTNPRTASPPPQPSPRMSAVPSRAGIPSSSSSTSTPRSRRQVLMWAGLGGGGLLLAIGLGQWQNGAPNDASTDVVPGDIDYSRLEGFLQEQQWQEADQETADLMLKVANREEEGWLDSDSINTFPCEVLSEIDRLWVQYSEGKFGFSVQSKIYFEDCGGDPSDDFDLEAWQCFGDRVGWRVNGQWISYSEVTFDTSAPTAHLPYTNIVRGGLLFPSLLFYCDM